MAWRPASGVVDRRASTLAAALVGGAAALAIAACGSDKPSATPDAGPPVCDTSRCDPGNECLNDGTDVQCRRPCEAHTGEKSCAFNWVCTKPDGAEKAFCKKSPLELEPRDHGQWGARCTPSKGIRENADCDAAQGFWCYGESPTDAEAFCTQYGCQLDSECGPGMWCAKVNQAPSVATTQRSFGKTLTVCKPRRYCAPCAADIDCPMAGGLPQVCVFDAKGETRFCTTECAKDTNCQLDARCITDPDLGKKVCFPRAGTCKGDGSLCAPCASDDDCPDGYCLTQQFSPERWCSVRSTSDCVRPKCATKDECSNGASCVNGECEYFAVRGTCPAPPKNSAVATGCVAAPDDPDMPQHQCYGLVPFGEGNNVGCWTRAR